MSHLNFFRTRMGNSTSGGGAKPSGEEKPMKMNLNPTVSTKSPASPIEGVPIAIVKEDLPSQQGSMGTWDSLSGRSALLAANPKWGIFELYIRGLRYPPVKIVSSLKFINQWLKVLNTQKQGGFGRTYMHMTTNFTVMVSYLCSLVHPLPDTEGPALSLMERAFNITDNGEKVSNVIGLPTFMQSSVKVSVSINPSGNGIHMVDLGRGIVFTDAPPLYVYQHTPVSGSIARVDVPSSGVGPAVFAGKGGSGWLRIHIRPAQLRVLAELSKPVLLLTDASGVTTKVELRPGEYHLPMGTERQTTFGVHNQVSLSLFCNCYSDGRTVQFLKSTGTYLFGFCNDVGEVSTLKEISPGRADVPILITASATTAIPGLLTYISRAFRGGEISGQTVLKIGVPSDARDGIDVCISFYTVLAYCVSIYRDPPSFAHFYKLRERFKRNPTLSQKIYSRPSEAGLTSGEGQQINIYSLVPASMTALVMVWYYNIFTLGKFPVPLDPSPPVRTSSDLMTFLIEQTMPKVRLGNSPESRFVALTNRLFGQGGLVDEVLSNQRIK